MTSRDTREYFIPSVPMLMPSEMVMALKITLLPPAASTPFAASAARRSMCMLHGVTMLHVEAMPILFFLKSSRLKPTACSIARLAARSTPSTTTELCLRLQFGLGLGSGLGFRGHDAQSIREQAGGSRNEESRASEGRRKRLSEVVAHSQVTSQFQAFPSTMTALITDPKDLKPTTPWSETLWAYTSEEELVDHKTKARLCVAALLPSKDREAGLGGV